MEDFFVASGLRAQARDARDYRLAAVLDDKPFDWDTGYSAYEEAGISPEWQDQDGSLSCVAQATARYLRVRWRRLTGEDALFSAAWVYWQIVLAGGGAYLKDGVKLAATVGGILERLWPSYNNGKPPNEAFVSRRPAEAELPALLAQAKKFDRFDYRMADPQVDSIEVFAKGAQRYGGLLGGVVGTNEGWCRPDCRPPEIGDSTWQHGIYISGAGRLDVRIGNLLVGTKCVFTPNSWGGRYVIDRGRWKGLQAIPESYFLAGRETAAGFVRGIYVYPAYALTPEADAAADLRRAELLARYDNCLLRNSVTGAFALCVGGKRLDISEARAGLAAITAYQRAVRCVNLPAADWELLPSAVF